MVASFVTLNNQVSAVVVADVWRLQAALFIAQTRTWRAIEQNSERFVCFACLQVFQSDTGMICTIKGKEKKPAPVTEKLVEINNVMPTQGYALLHLID